MSDIWQEKIVKVNLFLAKKLKIDSQPDLLIIVIFLSADFYSKLTFSKKSFWNQSEYLSVCVLIRPVILSGRTFCRAWSGSKLFAKVIGRWKKLPLARKELPTCVVCWSPLWTVCILIRPGIMSGLIRMQTVWHCDGIPERIFLKSWFWKKSADDKKSCKITQ